MRYLSVCSGIEAATVAWHPLGWEAVAYSEIERFPSEVLAHHYPNTPNVGDMTKFKEWTNVSDVDLLVGGTPCQSFSVAGLRKGLDDPRGNLMLTYLAITDKYRPRWLVWENVPGVLSSNGGLDFASLLRGMGELGYGFAYRILDAQYFGVAQRRRRVFVVGYLGDWRAAAAVLFERHSLSGHPAPSREKGQRIAPSVTTGPPFSRTGNDRVEAEAMVVWPPEIAPTIDAHFGNKQGLENQHINGGGGCLPLVSKCLITKNRMDAETETLIPTTGGHFSCEAIALAENTIGRQPQNGGNGDGFTDGGPMYTLNATGVHGVAQSMAVRRLTPKECERLQGFGDNYTDIKSKNKPTPDGPRYKSLGNSMAVPVMRWIGERIQKVEALNVP
jgi:DNA (cytosine-5)-methyltransferase 1